MLTQEATGLRPMSKKNRRLVLTEFWEHLDKSLIQVNTEIKDKRPYHIYFEEVDIYLDPGIQTPEDLAAMDVPPSFFARKTSLRGRVHGLLSHYYWSEIHIVTVICRSKVF